MKADLHIHSIYSNDGELGIPEILKNCHKNGVDTFSITDHNCVGGSREAMRLAAVDDGMELHYVDRTTFRKRETEDFLNSIRERFGNVYLLPVGGTNKIALKGCAEIIDQIDIDYNYICSASGSGGTFAGLIAGLKGSKQAIAFPALKGGEFLEEVISDLVSEYTGETFSNWGLNTDYHFGGFAKLSKELIDFTHEFNKLNGFELDYIYTNKMMFGIADLIKKEFFKSGETIVAIHSGGLQGNEGMREKVRKFG